MSDYPLINLTTVRQDPAGIARNAVRLAVDMREGNVHDDRQVVLEPQLIIRGTTAAPRDQRSTSVVSK